MALVHIQPALPAYRVDFFRRLAEHYGDDMRVYYSPVDMGTLTAPRIRASWDQPIGPMCQPFHGIEWQIGALSVPFQRGDIVVVCGAPRAISTLLVLIKARFKRARVIWWGQYWSATSEARRHRLRMKLSGLADALLFYTDVEVERFHADGWDHHGPVGALNNGINLTDVRRLRRSYDPAERGRNLMFIGRLTEKAKLGLMVQALSEPSLAEAHLHVIGSGDEEPAVRAQAAALGVAARISWYGGTTDEARISEVANRCAAFVYPGQVGLSLIHAMGYGLPCIVHDNPLHHMPEIAAFAAGETGMTFSEGSASSLALAASGLLTAPEERGCMAARCLEITRDDYTTEGMALRFIAFLDRVNKNGRTDPR
jgi:glycosyltransferase involved in cell wall biosynthesis